MSKCLIFPLHLFLEFNLTFSIFLFLFSLVINDLSIICFLLHIFLSFLWQKNPLPMRTFYLNHRKFYSATAYKSFGFLTLLKTGMSARVH